MLPSAGYLIEPVAGNVEISKLQLVAPVPSVRTVSIPVAVTLVTTCKSVDAKMTIGLNENVRVLPLPVVVTFFTWDVTVISEFLVVSSTVSRDA